MSLAQTEVPRILIADDEAPARARLRDLLDECRERFPLAIVDEARNGREVLDVLNREKVDIVLLDGPLKPGKRVVDIAQSGVYHGDCTCRHVAVTGQILQCPQNLTGLIYSPHFRKNVTTQ